MLTIKEIEKTVLALPLEQRVLLAESLLGSLPAEEAELTESEELEEAERRDHEIQSGRVKPLSDAEFWKALAGHPILA